jgi:hypothetical protein
MQARLTVLIVQRKGTRIARTYIDSPAAHFILNAPDFNLIVYIYSTLYLHTAYHLLRPAIFWFVAGGQLASLLLYRTI